MAPKRRNSKPQSQSAAAAPRSALDARQQALLAQQEELRRKMAKLEQEIQSAPLRKEAERNRRQAEMASRTVRVDAPTRSDMRYDTAIAGALPIRSRRKPLRSQQRQARLIFFGLLFALAILVIWLWSVWKW